MVKNVDVIKATSCLFCEYQRDRAFVDLAATPAGRIQMAGAIFEENRENWTKGANARESCCEDVVFKHVQADIFMWKASLLIVFIRGLDIVVS